MFRKRRNRIINKPPKNNVFNEEKESKEALGGGMSKEAFSFAPRGSKGNKESKTEIIQKIPVQKENLENVITDNIHKKKKKYIKINLT